MDMVVTDIAVINLVRGTGLGSSARLDPADVRNYRAQIESFGRPEK
jgi:hypothetical protein